MCANRQSALRWSSLKSKGALTLNKWRREQEARREEKKKKGGRRRRGEKKTSALLLAPPWFSLALSLSLSPFFPAAPLPRGMDSPARGREGMDEAVLCVLFKLGKKKKTGKKVWTRGKKKKGEMKMKKKRGTRQTCERGRATRTLFFPRPPARVIREGSRARSPQSARAQTVLKAKF